METHEADGALYPREQIIHGHERLARLQAAATVPRFVHAHAWAAGDVVVRTGLKVPEWPGGCRRALGLHASVV